MSADKPILQRLQLLADHYAEFAVAEKPRVFCWLLQPNEVRMVEAFIAREQDDEAGQLQEVFWPLETPFNDAVLHGYQLGLALVEQYHANAEAIVASGTNADWQSPPYEPHKTSHSNADVAWLIRCCESFLDHYSVPGRLGLVLRPSSVSDPSAYLLWLQRFAHAAPNRVRAMLLDFASQPAYAELVATSGELIVSCEPNLRMDDALAEVSREAGHLDTPGGQYRTHFLQLGKALGNGDLPEATQLAELALAIAVAQEWYHLQVPVLVALAGALSANSQHMAAVERYRAAEIAATTGQSTGPEETREVCVRLQLQARLGHGVALIHAQQPGSAAHLFEQTVPVAEQLQDARAVLDCYRLASFCHEQDDRPDEAMRNGVLGLQVARSMDDETKQSSTFPYLGEALMRLVQTPAQRHAAARLEREIIEIAGTRDWRPAPAPTATSSAPDQAGQ